MIYVVGMSDYLLDVLLVCFLLRNIYRISGGPGAFDIVTQLECITVV